MVSHLGWLPRGVYISSQRLGESGFGEIAERKDWRRCPEIDRVSRCLATRLKVMETIRLCSQLPDNRQNPGTEWILDRKK